MPKAGSKLSFDFSSLLGPLFFTWIIELLFPVSFYEIHFLIHNLIPIKFNIYLISKKLFDAGFIDIPGL